MNLTLTELIYTRFMPSRKIFLDQYLKEIRGHEDFNYSRFKARPGHLHIIQLAKCSKSI